MTNVEAFYESADYQINNKDWHESDAPWKASQIVKMLRRNHLQPRRIADIGCGVGRISHELSRELEGFDAIDGFDIAAEAVRIANEKYAGNGIAFHCGNLLEAERHYDLTLCMDVFEHVEDYMGFLRKLSAKSDYFIFHVPLEMNVSGILRERYLHSRKQLGHLHYFSKSSALATLRDTGYEIVDHFYTLGAMELESAHRGLVTSLTNALRRLMPDDLCSRTLGGMSLLVLCKAP